MRAAAMLCVATMLAIVAPPHPQIAAESTDPMSGRRYVPQRPVDPRDPLCCVIGRCCSASPASWPGQPQEQGDRGKTGIREDRPPRISWHRTTAQAAISMEAISSPLPASPACPNPLGLPGKAHAELCAVRNDPDLAVCSEAASTMLAFRLNDRSKGYTPDNYRSRPILTATSGRGSPTEQLAAYAAATRRYLDACLTALPATGGTGLLSPSQVAQIRQRVGILTDTARPGLRCNAVLHRGHVVTARHCIADIATGGIRSDLSTLTYRSADGTEIRGFASDALVSTALYAGARESRYDHRRNGDDIVGLPAPPAAPAGPDFEVGAAVAGERLIGVGHNINVATLDYIDGMLGDLPAPSRPFLEHFRIDQSPLCRAMLRAPDGCFLHACQTDSQMSGSPLFALSDQRRLRLVGIQVARIDDVESMSCWQERKSRYIPNAAAAIDRLPLPPAAHESLFGVDGQARHIQAGPENPFQRPAERAEPCEKAPC